MTGKWLSVPAVLWAMDDADGVPARLVSTLAAVARYAGEDGRGAFPSLAQVAWITRKSRAQAGRDIAALAQLGLLLPGDPGLVMHIRAEVRPNVWDLAMPPVSSRRDTPVSSRRDTPRGSPVSSGAGTRRMASKNLSRLDENKEDLNRSRTTRGRVGATAPRTSAPRAQDQTPRIAPPCEDCGTPYTASQLADDEFYAKAMAGSAGCTHPAAVNNSPGPPAARTRADLRDLLRGLDDTLTDAEVESIITLAMTDPRYREDPLSNIYDAISGWLERNPAEDPPW